ncbi:hypothetical protein XENTR_v10005579 [Xenopus tropicalis]|nr:hypothetical protein XENTR_v10005579 [Xenopus tropicalis]
MDNLQGELVSFPASQQECRISAKIPVSPSEGIEGHCFKVEEDYEEPALQSGTPPFFTKQDYESPPQDTNDLCELQADSSGSGRKEENLQLSKTVRDAMPALEKLLSNDWREILLGNSAVEIKDSKGTKESLAEKELQLLFMIHQLTRLRDQLLSAHSEHRNMAAMLFEKQQQQMELARQQQEQIVKQQQQLIQQQHKINLLQQQIQHVNMPYVMIPAFPPAQTVTADPQMSLPIQPIPCKPVEYPMSLLHNSTTRGSVSAKRQETSQPLNLTAKPTDQVPNSRSSPKYRMSPVGSQGGSSMDSASSPQKANLPLGFLGEGDAITKAIQEACQLLHGQNTSPEHHQQKYRKVTNM